MSNQTNKQKNTFRVIASGNTGKIKEIQACLPQWQLIPQAQLGVSEIEETGLTFIENALMKARHAAHITGLPALADDSGLVVEALQGAPGIYSQRYAQKEHSLLSNHEYLLTQMKAIPWEERQAYFYCVLVYMNHAMDPSPVVVSARWHGMIALTAEGDYGFGYDPVFYLPKLHKTAAMLSPEEKNQYSHRAQALQLLQAMLV